VSVRKPFPVSSLLCVLLPTLGSLVLRVWLGDVRWVHEPLHAALETAGGVIALALAGVLLWRRRFMGHAPHLLWVSTALVFMGLLDLAHAWVSPSPAFFWSRMLPSVVGGLLLCLVWAPERWARAASAERLPLRMGWLALPLCVALVAFPDAWPHGYVPGGAYTPWAKLVNVAGGLSFFAAALFFLRRARRTGDDEERVFANHCLLFAMAGILFGLSHLWGPIWWLFHLLRLLAYVVVLRHVLRVWQALQASAEAALVARLEQREVQIRLVTDALPVLVSFIGPDERYVYTNQGYSEWFGLPRGALVGKPVREVLGEEAYRDLQPHLAQAMAGQSVRFEQTLADRHGGARHVRVSYMPQRNAQGAVEGVVALVADVTEEHEARERAGRLQAVTAALSRALTPEDVARVSLQELVDGRWGADGGTLYVLDAPGGPLRLLHGQGVPRAALAGFDAVPLEAPLPMASAARRGAPEWLPSREEMLARFPGMEAAVGLSQNQAWVALPLLGGTGPLGALMLGFRRQLPPGEHGRSFLLALGQQAGHALERASLYAASRAAVQVREDFLSVAGHELRTPLTSLKLQLGMLERTVLAAAPEGARQTGTQRLRTIERQVGRLEALVGSLLDVGRLSTGRLELEPGDVELGALVREVVDRLADVFERAGSPVVLEAEGEVRGRWDAGRLDQVLVNLLTNAAKYGAGRPVRVRLERAGPLARLVVADEGIGIAPEALGRIFGRFERGVSDRQYGGLGLGLYISRALVQAMGGEVRVESELGQGATFTVELPLEPPAA
jgi:PAS domain S-box-containing protein